MFGRPVAGERSSNEAVDDVADAAGAVMYSADHDEENRVLLCPVSVADERSALAPPVSLFDQARRLHQAHPDGPLPDGGIRPNPVTAPSQDRRQALTALLRNFIADPAVSAQDLHDRCAQLAFRSSDLRIVCDGLNPGPSPRLVHTARQLVRTGTDQGAVLVGLALLRGNADQHDIAVVKTLGLLRFAAVQAPRVLLAAIPGAEADLIWLVERAPWVRDNVVTCLSRHPDPAVRDWVRSTPQLHRKITEVPLLRELLQQPLVDDLLWDQAGDLLFEMSCTQYYAEIGKYWDATAAFRRWTDLADQRPATVNRAVLLLSVAEELATGYAGVVVGDPRGGLVDQLKNVLISWTDLLEHAAWGDDPGEARRAAWVLRQITGLGVPQTRFAVRVVPHAPDPVSVPVETRILIDGTPVVAAAWRGGWSDPPERVLHGGRLRATSEPREIVLDENDGTELYVTIVREGAEVVWKDWRWDLRPELPGEFRFAASQYDQEVVRAEEDHSWEWPARTVSRLVNDHLRADPTVLGRWGCGFSRCRNASQDHDFAYLDFRYPADAAWRDPSVTFRLGFDVGDRDPEVVADEVIATLCTSDPKKTVEMVGVDSKAAAEHLGLVHRPSTRRYF